MRLDGYYNPGECHEVQDGECTFYGGAWYKVEEETTDPTMFIAIAIVVVIVLVIIVGVVYKLKWYKDCMPGNGPGFAVPSQAGQASAGQQMTTTVGVAVPPTVPRFDPNTGQPILQPPSGNIEAQIAQAEERKRAEEARLAALVEEKRRLEAPRFDPMTGQPIPKFDPQTGQQNWWDAGELRA